MARSNCPRSSTVRLCVGRLHQKPRPQPGRQQSKCNPLARSLRRLQAPTRPIAPRRLPGRGATNAPAPEPPSDLNPLAHYLLFGAAKGLRALRVTSWASSKSRTPCIVSSTSGPRARRAPRWGLPRRGSSMGWIPSSGARTSCSPRRVWAAGCSIPWGKSPRRIGQFPWRWRARQPSSCSPPRRAASLARGIAHLAGIDEEPRLGATQHQQVHEVQIQLWIDGLPQLGA